MVLKGVAAAMMWCRTKPCRAPLGAFLIASGLIAGLSLSAAAAVGDVLLQPTPLILKDGRIANVSVHVVAFGHGQAAMDTAVHAAAAADDRGGRDRLLPDGPGDRPRRLGRGRRERHAERPPARPLARRCRAGLADRGRAAGQGDRERLGLAVHGARRAGDALGVPPDARRGLRRRAARCRGARAGGRGSADRIQRRAADRGPGGGVRRQRRRAGAGRAGRGRARPRTGRAGARPGGHAAGRALAGIAWRWRPRRRA